MSSVARNKGSDDVHIVHYPERERLNSHEKIVRDSSVFWDTLRRFHFQMNTKFMIPVIGGKELDLHVLYTEVTRRGGFDKVVAEKKWREVGSVFMFSPTTTSSSFVLKKHYSSLLYHYEQVHFFRPQGPLRTSSATFSPVSSGSWKNEWALVPYSSSSIKDCPDNHFQATGTIEGKFDRGYLVNVKLGSEVLSGVLYHPKHSGTTSPVPRCSNAIVPYTGKPPGRTRRRRRRNNKRDPNYPKTTRSGYNFFFAENHYKLKSLYPNREREFTKMIGESWSKLGQEERKVYQNIGLKDKERYRRELKEYKERMKLRQNMEVD